MAFRTALRRSAAVPMAASAVGAATILFPFNTLHAEAPTNSLPSRKPIYDDLIVHTTPKPKYSPTTPDSQQQASTPSPTNRLAEQVGRARIFVHAHVVAAENGLNNLMTRALNLESDFTSTVASLAPEPSTGEQLLPGAIYVLVAAMAGSIVSRNRNILLRATVPVAVGIGTGWLLLPNTMRNVADLTWQYEKRVPVIAENHLRIRKAVEEAWKEANLRSKGLTQWTDERVRESREAVEGWVRKGR